MDRARSVETRERVPSCSGADVVVLPRLRPGPFSSSAWLVPLCLSWRHVPQFRWSDLQVTPAWKAGDRAAPALLKRLHELWTRPRRGNKKGTPAFWIIVIPPNFTPSIGTYWAVWRDDNMEISCVTCALACQTFVVLAGYKVLHLCVYLEWRCISLYDLAQDERFVQQSIGDYASSTFLQGTIIYLVCLLFLY